MKPGSKTSKTNPSARPSTAALAPAAPASPADIELFKREAVNLSARQQQAVIAIAGGRNFADAARAAGVTRQTLRNWRANDLHFIAALNVWQNELLASAQSRLLNLTDEAVTSVSDAVAGGDVHASLEILRRMGFLTPAKTGPADPAEVQREIAMAKEDQAASFARREQFLRQDAVLAKLLP